MSDPKSLQIKEGNEIKTLVMKVMIQSKKNQFLKYENIHCSICITVKNYKLQILKQGMGIQYVSGAELGNENTELNKNNLTFKVEGNNKQNYNILIARIGTS